MKTILLSILCVAMGIYCNAQNSLSQIELETFVTGYNSPVGIYNAGDERLFILEQSQGDIEIVDLQGNYIGKFLDLTGLLSTGGERGLLGLAFHPDYSSNGKFYVNYTDVAGNTVVEEYTVSSDPNVADATSGEEIISITQDFSNHNGGHIAFGADGFLYIGMGDGGSAGDPNNRAQNGASLLGKMLRINVTGDGTYSIPADNPYLGNANVLDEIWSIGLRNPWKFSFDNSTGDLWIGDVGQSEIEEINFEPATSTGGINYGWKCFEGTQPYANTSQCDGLALVDPVAEYEHSFPDGPCSITGGIVYRGSQFPNMQGNYIFTDYCDAKFYSLYPNGNGGYDEELLLLAGQFGFVAFGEDMNNELYVVNAGGSIYRITDPCSELNVSLVVNENELVASGAAGYEWLLDGTNIPNASGSMYTPSSNGSYSVRGFTEDGCEATTTSISLAAGGLYLRGCTLECASNYNPDAVIDDGSCAQEATCGGSFCAGDLNGDGAITIGDLSGFLAAFGNLCD
ncbi:MAG: sorbosone dehydrogenase family protein [Flavobacteriales bacterium]